MGRDIAVPVSAGPVHVRRSRSLKLTDQRMSFVHAGAPPSSASSTTVDHEAATGGCRIWRREKGGGHGRAARARDHPRDRLACP
jgi:hypothetical protein